MGFFVSKLAISFFLGKVAGEFIPVDSHYWSGFIMLLGFFAHPVLGIAEVKAWARSFNPPGAS